MTVRIETGIDGRNIKEALASNWEGKGEERENLGKCLGFWGKAG